MKSNLTKKVLAFTMASTMMVSLFSMPAFADGGTGSVALTATVQAPKYVLGVPKTVAVSLNPQQIGLTNNSTVTEGDFKGLTSPEVVFSNLSNLPVAVDVSVFAKVPSKTTFYGDVDDVPSTKADTSKGVYAFVEFAKSMAAPTALVAGKGTYESDTAAPVDNMQEFPASTAGSAVKSNDFTLVLDAATYSVGTTPAATALATQGAAGFKLGGKVSAYGGWLPTEFVVNLVYDAQTILASEAVDITYGTDGTDGTGTVAGTTDATSYRAYVKDSTAFDSRQVGLKANDTVGTTITANGVTGDLVATLCTTADGKTTLATTTGITGSWTASGKILLKTDTNFKATTPTTVYVKFSDSLTTPTAAKTFIVPVTIYLLP